MSYSRLIPHFYAAAGLTKEGMFELCQCLLGLIPHFYCFQHSFIRVRYIGVNALSGLYLISTSNWGMTKEGTPCMCQCPLGLIPHFYGKHPVSDGSAYCNVSMPSRAYTSFLPSIAEQSLINVQLACQCPLGLIPHFYRYLDTGI